MTCYVKFLFYPLKYGKMARDNSLILSVKFGQMNIFSSIINENIMFNFLYPTDYTIFKHNSHMESYFSI